MLLYEASFMAALSVCSLNLGFMLASMILGHGVITSAGFLFTDADILRQGNEQLLDDLEEGLVIL